MQSKNESKVGVGSMGRVAGLLGLLGALLTGCDTQVIGQDTPEIAQAYSDMARQWWKWIAAIPVESNPIFDETGEHCHVAQPATDVWFLASSQEEGIVERTCAIPAETSLFFPLASDVAVSPPSDSLGLIAKLTRLDLEYDEVCAVSVEYDGELLADDPAALRVTASTFVLELAIGNFLKAAPGTYVAGTDGYWAYMTPPEPGVHSLRFGVSYCDQNGRVVSQRGADYKLIVEDPMD